MIVRVKGGLEIPRAGGPATNRFAYDLCGFIPWCQGMIAGGILVAFLGVSDRVNEREQRTDRDYHDSDDDEG